VYSAHAPYELDIDQLRGDLDSLVGRSSSAGDAATVRALGASRLASWIFATFSHHCSDRAPCTADVDRRRKLRYDMRLHRVEDRTFESIRGGGRLACVLVSRRVNHCPRDSLNFKKRRGEKTIITKLPALVFDVNETLLDLETLTPQFVRIFGDGRVMREWFAQLILYSEALTLAGKYVAFGELGGAVLEMVGSTRRQRVTAEDVLAVRQAIASMPCHPEVPGALRRLRDAGFRLCTLTNNPVATAKEQLERAGLADFFDQQFSVDGSVHRYKPAPETYRCVEHQLGIASCNCCMIACHTWDTLGAVAAGWQAALVIRPGNAPLAVGPQPHIVGEDLILVAASLIARYGNTAAL